MVSIWRRQMNAPLTFAIILDDNTKRYISIKINCSQLKAVTIVILSWIKHVCPICKDNARIAEQVTFLILIIIMRKDAIKCNTCNSIMLARYCLKWTLCCTLRRFLNLHNKYEKLKTWRHAERQLKRRSICAK